MLLSLGHGQRILLPNDTGLESGAGAPSGTKSIAAVAPGAKLPSRTTLESGLEAGLSGTDLQSFGYMFPDAPGVSGSPVDAIKALAAAMIEGPNDPSDADSSIPPIFTYLGQFIDHDITANTDRDAPQPNPVSEMTGPTVDPLDRAVVVSSIANLRNGSLRLDSLYGEGPSDTPFTQKLREAMRDSSDRAKMRVGPIGPLPFGELPPLPDDGLGDLPRLGDILADPNSGLTQADLEALPAGDLKDSFIKDGVVQAWRAIIGDGRNDENLLVAQLHCAFLRLHNAVADSLKTDIPDAEDRFEEAKRRTILIYQWLVVNVYLPKVCDPAVVDAVKAAGAPLYKSFRERVAKNAPELPLPLEFSAAVFRFGHSMVRGTYDHNRNFGRPAAANAQGGATFRQLFSFTGGDFLGKSITGQELTRLAGNWPIEWDRFAKDNPDHPDHRARKIDTRLAPPLGDMFKEAAQGDLSEMARILKHLAERNLRRAHRLNIPTGQGAVAAINEFDGSSGGGLGGDVYKVAYKPDYDKYKPEPPEGGGIAPLPEAVLSEGEAGAALGDGGMLDATPLWYYILREAEVTAGDHLGPLGSRIVAETLVGLVVEDADSYWAEGDGDGSWSPSELPVDGKTVNTMPAMLQACGLMT